MSSYLKKITKSKDRREIETIIIKSFMPLIKIILVQFN